jgi:hypothetical protein
MGSELQAPLHPERMPAATRLSQPRVESLPSWLLQGLPQTRTPAATRQHQHLDVVVQQAADAHTGKHNTRRGEKIMHRRRRMAKAVNEKEAG